MEHFRNFSATESDRFCNCLETWFSFTCNCGQIKLKTIHSKDEPTLKNAHRYWEVNIFPEFLDYAVVPNFYTIQFYLAFLDSDMNSNGLFLGVKSQKLIETFNNL